MVKLVLVSIISLIYLGDQVIAAIPSISSVNLEIRREKGELDSLRKNLNKLKNEILSLKTNVGSETEKFSKIISIKNNLKNEINNQKTILVKEEKGLEKEISILNQIFAGMILTDDSEEEIDYRFVTLRKLKEKEKELKKKKNAIIELNNNVVKMQKELEEYDFLEADLISNIEKMHSLEKELSQKVSRLNVDIGEGENKLNKLKIEKNKFITKMSLTRDKKNKEKKEINKQSIQNTQDGKVSISQTKAEEGGYEKLNFVLPLSKFEKIQKDKNGGVNLYVNSDRSIMAPENGVIMYTGKLSTYGNVIVIKHDNEYQSIILGDIIPNVQKSQLVNKSDVIGKIIENSGDFKKVYYELRNKNKKVSYNKLVGEASI